jgi:hypothetical protein
VLESPSLDVARVGGSQLVRVAREAFRLGGKQIFKARKEALVDA